MIQGGAGLVVVVHVAVVHGGEGGELAVALGLTLSVDGVHEILEANVLLQRYL